jgi:hypothetical protein
MNTPCEVHDIMNAEKHGYLDYRCPDCGADITLEIALLKEMQEGKGQDE